MSDVLRDLVSKATPGSWEFAIEDGDEWWFGGGNQARIRRVDGREYESVAVLGGDTPEELADARLIALAPDLALLVADLRDELVDVTARWPERTSTRALLVRVDRLTEGTE